MTSALHFWENKYFLIHGSNNRSSNYLNLEAEAEAEERHHQPIWMKRVICDNPKYARGFARRPPKTPGELACEEKGTNPKPEKSETETQNQNGKERTSQTHANPDLLL